MTEVTATLGPVPVAVVVLVLWLIAHRFVAHRIDDIWTPRTGSRQWTTVVLVVEALAMVTVAITGGAVGWHAVSLPVFLAANGLLLASTVMIRSSRLALGRHFSVYLVTGAEHSLITDGLYKRIRHPIYTGEVLFHLGVPLVTCTYEALAFLPFYIWLLHVRMTTEERLLSDRYPDYAEYTQTSWRLVPHIY